MTPHNEAKKEDIAKIALLAGDPLRAKKIAETYLENPKLVNRVRNMFMYTGFYKGVRVTVGGHGMGVPSMGIYSYELFKFYDVDTIIRIGSAGSYREDLKVFDVFNVQKAEGDSDYSKLAGGPDQRVAYPSKSVYDLIEQTAKEKGIDLKTGVAYSSDVFYRPEGFDQVAYAKEHNYSVVEMESYALFTNALITGKQAATLLTISDSLVSHQEISAEERENNFNTMVELALDSAIKLNK